MELGEEEARSEARCSTHSMMMDAAQVGEVSTVVLIPKYTQWDRRIFVTSRGTSGGKDFSREILHHMRLPAISPIPH
jgi:hypothetical protein